MAGTSVGRVVVFSMSSLFAVRSSPARGECHIGMHLELEGWLS